MQKYLGWDELGDEGALPLVEPSSDTVPGWDSLERLLQERSHVEQQLLRLLGKAPPTPADARELARFPMPVHTAESRMADRRAARDEERARAAARRSIERLRSQVREEHQRAEQRRHGAAATLAAAAQRAADARRENERQQDRARALLVEALIRQVWGEQRVAALDASRHAVRKERSDFAERYARCHERARRQMTQRRAAEEALVARLDSRSRRSTIGDEPGRRRGRERTA